MMSRDFTERANEFVLFDSRSLQVGAPAYESAIRDVLNRIQATGRVTQIHSPLDPSYDNQISADRHAALLWWCSRCPCCTCTPRNRASATCRRTPPPYRRTTASSRQPPKQPVTAG